MFTQSEEFGGEHDGRIGDIAISWKGQMGAREAPIWSSIGRPKGEHAGACETIQLHAWKQTRMNLAIRGIDVNLNANSHDKNFDNLRQQLLQ